MFTSLIRPLLTGRRAGLTTRGVTVPVLIAFSALSHAAPDEKTAIPLDQLGAEAQKQYTGDGIRITPTNDGARLKAIMQDLEGEATAEGLWLTSTADEDAGKPNRLRVRGLALGREGSTIALPAKGMVRASSDSAVWMRPGVIEEYTVSTEGVRQDFVIPRRPAGTQGGLIVELEVTGARAESAGYGATLTVNGTGRELAYSRLKVTDATGKELHARMDIPAPDRLHVMVEDAGAAYPVRIDPTFSDADWISMGGIVGTNSSVYALASNSGDLYVGGAFTIVGDMRANYIAKWDGTAWSALGGGMNGNVNALVVSGSNVYAGGSFSAAGGVAANHIAKWDGTRWSSLGAGVTGPVWSLAVSGSDLYAGHNGIAKWNGSTWSVPGNGLGGYVFALAVSGNDIFAGGSFGNIAKWNGNEWSAIGSVSGNVNALAVSGSSLYAGGAFITVSGVEVNRVAKWNGSVWSAMGAGWFGEVRALALFGNDLYVSGEANNWPDGIVYYIAKWNGASLSVDYMNQRIYSLAVSNGELYAGGDFTGTLRNVPANRIARWNGSTWGGLGTGLSAGVNALAVSGSDLYAGGSFVTAGGLTVNGIAKWNGSTWSALGTGMQEGWYSTKVNALAAIGSDLYAGGDFYTAGGVAVRRIAKWNGSAWSALGSGISGADVSIVFALAVIGSDLYAGGRFSTAGGVATNNIAKWNGSAWSVLGSGMSSSVAALAVNGSDLYAGGHFIRAGGMPAEYIAKWNGSTWSAVGAEMNGLVYALSTNGNDLYAGGAFTAAGGMPVNRIARWNGIAWSAVGSGMNDEVRALTVIGSDLYAGGRFTAAGGVSANYIAKWNGSVWSALGSGTNYWVEALAASGGDLYAGGQFTTAGGKVSAYVARANAGFPEIALSGNDTVITNGDATPATGDHTDFGTTPIAGGTVARTFTISNSGMGVLNLTGAPPGYITLTGSGAFSVTAQPLSATVSANGGTVTFTITYDPDVAGTDGATVSIATDDSDESPFTFAISGTGLTGLESWRLHWFGTTANRGDAADTVDFDKDGLVNLIEWACHLDPTAVSTAPATLVRNGASLEFTYTRSVSAVDAGAAFAVEWIDTLAGADPWGRDGVTEHVLSGNGTAQVVKAMVPAGSEGRRFVHLRITAPP